MILLLKMLKKLKVIFKILLLVISKIINNFQANKFQISQQMKIIILSIWKVQSLMTLKLHEFATF